MKPQNLLGALEGQLKLADFGLGTAVRSGSDGAALIVGTPEYMAPEVWQGQSADPRSDIYSLAAVLYFMLTGRPPFRGKSREELRAAHLTGEIVFPDSIPDPITSLLRVMMAKSPEQRPENAVDALEMIASCLSTLRPTAGDRKSRLTGEDSLGSRAERAMLELPTFADAGRRLEQVVLSGAALVVVTGMPVGLQERMFDRLVERYRDQVAYAARIRIDESTSGLFSGIVRAVSPRLKPRGDPPGVAHQQLIDVLSPVAASRRRLLRMTLTRPLTDSDERDVAELMRRAGSRNLAFIVLSEGNYGERLYRGLQHGWHRTQVELVHVPRMSLPEGSRCMRLWIRAVRSPELLRWSVPALTAAAAITVERPEQARAMAHNAQTVAMAAGMRIVTTWCLRGAAAHEGLIEGPAQIDPAWRISPLVWPDAAELARQAELAVLNLGEDGVDFQATEGGMWTSEYSTRSLVQVRRDPF